MRSEIFWRFATLANRKESKLSQWGKSGNNFALLGKLVPKIFLDKYFLVVFNRRRWSVIPRQNRIVIFGKEDG